MDFDSGDGTTTVMVILSYAYRHGNELRRKIR
jgi:hypothetical protein